MHQNTNILNSPCLNAKTKINFYKASFVYIKKM